MPWFDLPLAALREHRTATEEPVRLDKWWAERLDEARAAARPPMATRYQTQVYGPLHAYDVEFSGAAPRGCPSWCGSSGTAEAAGSRLITRCCPRQAMPSS